jgi:ubiquinone/menaquinone biosynthesis C-methylase UbiE
LDGLTAAPQSTDPAAATRERNRDFFGGAFGPVYSFYMEHPPLSRLIARLVWGADIRPFYASMEEIGRVRDGGLIVDAPCGAGVAFRGLRPDQQVRYVAVDLSPAMLERAKRRAAARGLDRIEFLEADAHSIPLEDGSADLFLSYWGLHCFADPRAALAESHRCLRPGGRLVGGTVVKGFSRRQQAIVRPYHRAFGAVPSAEQVRAWIEDLYGAARIEPSGSFLYFNASK